MGGKARRRRERNYRAAHGGYDRLPPPPDTSQIDALPSKLRKLISFTSSRSQESDKVSKDAPQKHKRETVKAEKKSHLKDDVGNTSIKDGGNGGNSHMSQLTESGDDVRSKSSEKKNRKRKRKQVNDLRFETPLEDSDRRLKRRERQKKYQEARKNKHKRAMTEENLDFSRHEKVKFGDVVQAPPKLVAVPKAFKSAQDASQERKRLQAINEYRNRKGWTSRPGIQLPSMTISPTI